ncbi:alcohol oxidase [Sodiomyces alkalinus F11]|uniref:Alcohol oxidase n=1 Tax=Sodiomyces alkalinus (strain CBS 110278 / VKM F-3762 / F11) TaxID=1314773 RepID=A0A3N2Q7H1_SODAK|nr:alcohol oxidase [Sodiomyces alkalinus F11]ROT42656.1 alcohol oxidase [Sodiomyces alkalinus F11]
MRRLICAAPALLSILVSHVAALPAHAREATVITRRDDILDEYDFIVVGAGTAGLTVADRLSESGDYTVLVIEYGYLDMSHSIEATVRPDIDSGPSDEFPRATRFYNLTAVPQPGLGYSTPPLMAGAVVGGSSAVNGMFFMRGSAEDYDSWVWAAGEEHEEAFAEEWGWDNILPYFKKSVTFTPPTEEMVREYNITYDVEAAYGGTTPIHSSYRPFHWPATVAMWNAFKRIPGFRFPKEGAAGDQTGVIWAPNSRDPATERRSFSRPGHYTQEDGPASRDNFHLLTGHRVTQLILSPAPTPDSDNWSADGMRYTPRDGDMPESAWEVRAKREVIIAAGAAHTPQVLQRSGIGPRQVLEAAGAEVKVELPGVGENFQDHMNFAISYISKSFSPNSTTLSRDPEYAAQALDLWETNKTGPYTTFVNSAVFLPLPHFTNRTEEIVGKLLAQDPAEYLHEGVDETVIAGYVEQKKTLARQFRSEGSTLLEVPFSGGSSFSIVLCKSISRGTIHLSPDDDGVDPSGRGNVEPLVDYRAFSNPLDLDLVVELLRGTRQFMSADAMVETFGPVETSPGAHITSDEDLKAWIASRISPSTGHPVGTASLAPRELGGVVGPDLRVYGTRKLSVADNSIMPLVPSTHTSSTAYAIGEKVSFP